MSEIKTDAAVVSEITSGFSQSVSGVSFNAKANFAFSSSSASTGLESCLTDLTSHLDNFTRYAASDSQKLTKIHEAIKESEKKAVK